MKIPDYAIAADNRIVAASNAAGDIFREWGMPQTPEEYLMFLSLAFHHGSAYSAERIRIEAQARAKARNASPA